MYETVLDADKRAIRELVSAIRAGRPRDACAWSHNRRSEIAFDSHALEFYSYGRWFPLARYIPRAGRRSPAVWIVNGDEWRGANRGWNRSRTPDHQEETRRAIAETGDASLILPFSAVSGAGIAFETVRPIDVRDDARWTEYDALPDDVDLDALELAACRPFDNGDRSTAGADYVWRGKNGREYKRTLYRRAYSYTANGWRETDAATFAADPAGAAVSQHSYLNGSRTLERRADGWRIRRDVHRLGDALFSAERQDPRSGERFRRARYVSSFDYNENPPLYFMAEIPRGAGADTVDAAIDALAPRAVHAAMARGIDVCRQGDVFFIATRQTRETLAADGATFARLTQWTRDAAPRAGEVGFIARPPIAERRRRAELERRARVREFRERFRGAADRAAAGYSSRERETDAERVARRAETRARFRELFERHALELAAVRAAGADPSAPDSLECAVCGAPAGESCRPIAADEFGSASLAERIETERRLVGMHARRRDAYPSSLAARQSRELETLRDETRAARPSRSSSRPETRAGARRRFAATRAAAAAAVDKQCESLRRAVFAPAASTSTRYRYGGPSYRESELDYRRRIAADNARHCRAELERALVELEESRHARGTARDCYRRLFGNNAAATLQTARHNAAVRYRPESIAGADGWQKRRERVRAAVAIFGTAHAATETARMRDGRVYARGMVRHVPELEPGRNGAPDHRPLALADDVWYLAVRNTVPRQSRRRRSRAAETIGR